MPLFAAAIVLFALHAVAPPDSYLLRAERALELVRQDIPAMQTTVDEAAGKLATGAKFYATGQPALISEFTGRAGGFMMLKNGSNKEIGPDDVVLHFTERFTDQTPASGCVIVFDDGLAGPRAISNHAGETGLSPTVANAIAGWVFTGELIAALTRRGKMPVIYESIGAYTGNARIQQFKDGAVSFHADMTVPPVAPGVLGTRFVETVTGMLRRIEQEERGKLDMAAAWIRQARQEKKNLFMYSMGHLFPAEIQATEIGKVFQSAVWNAGFRMSPPPDDIYAPGDVAVHIAYQHPARLLCDRATAAGARVVYVSVMPDRNYMTHPGVIWLDPMWDWSDACVSFEGYDVPLLAASGVVNAALAWEIYRVGTS